MYVLSGDHELYDMNSDPVQMQNQLAGTDLFESNSKGKGKKGKAGGKSSTSSQSGLVDRLDALLMVTKSCAQETCREPWASLFPDGDVSTLSDALDSQYDEFFAGQPKISYSSCDQGYIISEEGPLEVTPF